MPTLKQGDTVLFQGDSITDAGRNREVDTDTGKGYVYLASSQYASRHPEHQITFLNRGLGGHTVKALRDRWEADCLNLKPSVVSILVGINDNRMAGTENKSQSMDEFERILHKLHTDGWFINVSLYASRRILLV
ncbi:GDSL-type esterase/lipase family protein [Paenibacillus qinlingensis]|uniref:GDSL-type esterase/lipase family protein n=1 Tax=Paenibacillus qinlingensis TaxID=1837343 RepID=UPI0015664A4F|nr:GDSL-type esterase/lipase family protein [Paenibacillus qinlingensis]NQX58110.1 hypothetical protein [Paenibacillus qinlingensis]